MKATIKGTLFGSSIVLLGLLIALGVHIYIVTQPKADACTQILARIDFKQDITDDDAAKIYSWLNKQQGIDRVVFNTTANNVVFTFSPLKINADRIANDLQTNLNYQACRYKPSTDDMKKGCPVSEKSMTHMVYGFFKNIF